MVKRNVKASEVARLMTKYQAGTLTESDFNGLLVNWLEDHQREAYQAVKAGKQTAPEIQQALNLKSLQYASTLLKNLCDLGLVKRERAKGSAFVYSIPE